MKNISNRPMDYGANYLTSNGGLSTAMIFRDHNGRGRERHFSSRRPHRSRRAATHTPAYKLCAYAQNPSDMFRQLFEGADVNVHIPKILIHIGRFDSLSWLKRRRM
jgi:hypothetical protein